MLDEERDPTEALDLEEDEDELDGMTVKGPNGEDEEETPVDPEEVF